jgi:hypothetical protein
VIDAERAEGSGHDDPEAEAIGRRKATRATAGESGPSRSRARSAGPT